MAGALRMAALAAALMAAAAAPAQDAAETAAKAGLILPVTEGRGPGERIIGFEVAPGALTSRLPDAKVARLGDAILKRQDEAEKDLLIDLGMESLGLGVGASDAMVSFTRHALFLDDLAMFSDVLTDVSLMMTVAQVARDAWMGRDAEALAGGLKGWMSFVVGKWGTGAMQVGNVAVFFVDITLKQWQSGLSEIANDVWTCRYQGWYRDHPRSIAQWKVKLWELFLAAEAKGDATYATYIDGTLNEYVGLAFRDPDIALYGDCGDSSFGDRAFVQRRIEAEHKAVLERMLVAQVLPEIGERAYVRHLRAVAKLAEERLMFRLNREYLLEVTAYGYPGGTPVAMPLPAGSAWKGKLREDGTFRTKVTLHALIKAGMPDRVTLDGPNGTEERTLTRVENRLIATFGTPETPMVSRYSLTEGAGQCSVTRREGAAAPTVETVAAEARPAREVDLAMLPSGAWVMGDYRPGAGWGTASPGSPAGDGIVFGPPFLDGIAALKGCQMGFLVADTVAQAGCTVTRTEAKQVSARVHIERSCTAPARLVLKGVFASVVSGTMEYYPLDGPEGQVIADVLKRSITEGVAGGMPAIPGMPAMPGGN